MRRLLVSAIGVLLLAGAALGCTQKLGTFGLVSNRDVHVDPEILLFGVEGESCVYNLLGLFPVKGGMAPSAGDAMARALAQVPEGNVLLNAAFYSDITYAFLYSKHCTRVKADVGRIR
jgi:hypothetical protein